MEEEPKKHNWYTESDRQFSAYLQGLEERIKSGQVVDKDPFPPKKRKPREPKQTK